jgi:uncharacterized OB-fold protein
MKHRNREYEARHKALGLCQKCSNPVFPGRVKCLKCLEKDRIRIKARYYKNHKYEIERNNKRRARYIAEGRCPKCGAPVLDGFQTCVNCTNRLPQGLTPTWRLEQRAADRKESAV